MLGHQPAAHSAVTQGHGVVAGVNNNASAGNVSGGGDGGVSDKAGDRSEDLCHKVQKQAV